MEREKVKLSKQGYDYLNNHNCSAIVRAVLRSIETYSAEVIEVNESIIRLKLTDSSLPKEFIEENDFAVHRDHLVLI